MEKNTPSFLRLMASGARLHVNGDECVAFFRGETYEVLYDEFREAISNQELRLVLSDPVNREAIYMAGSGL